MADQVEKMTAKGTTNRAMSRDVAEEYASSLADLTVNSKPLINMLTMLAEDYIDHAPIIVKAVEAHLQKVPGDIKLPVLYLIDSIVKNVGKDYISLFTQNIVSTFCSVFEKVDEKVRTQMFKLRQTWNDVFPSKKLYALDARVNAIDPAWPITAPPPTSIHLNPKFLQGTPSGSPVPSPDPVSPNINDGVMREQLLKKQKELLELQKRKVELELLQTKVILEEQQKKLENHSIMKLDIVSSGTTSSSNVSSPESVPTNVNDGIMREELLKNQKELLELQKRKVELELQQTKAILEEQQKKLENHNVRLKPESVGSKSTQGPNKDEGQFTRLPDRMFVPSHIPSQSDGATTNATVHPQETGGRNQISGPNQKCGSGNLKTNESKSNAVPSTVSASVRSRDPRIRLKERLNEKKPKISDSSETSELSITSRFNLLSTNSDQTAKNKRENKKKKLLSKRKEKNYEKIQKAFSSSSDSDKQNKELGFLPNDKVQRLITKRDKSDKKLNAYKLKIGSKLSKIPSAVEPVESDKTPNQKYIGDKISYDKNRKEDVEAIVKKDACDNLSEKSFKMDEINEQDHKMGKKSCQNLTIADARGVTSVNNGASKAEKRKMGNIEILSKRICITDGTKSLCDNVDSESKTHSAFLKTKQISRNRFPKYVRDNADSPQSSSSSSSSLSPATANISSVMTSSLTSSTDEISGKDVDLRLLPSPTKRRVAEPDPTTLKKTKAEIMDTLFGNEDVDLRTLPPQPPTPPPPIISEPVDTPDSEKSWANYKQVKNDSKSPEEKRRRSKIDRLGRPLLYNQKKGEGSDDEKNVRQSDNERSHSNCNLIIKQAEEQLNSGNITFSQYNRMLKEVITMNEERKLQEAQRKDELEGCTTQQSNSVTSGQPDIEDKIDPAIGRHEGEKSEKFGSRFEDTAAQNKEFSDPESRAFVDIMENKPRHFKPELHRKQECERNYSVPGSYDTNVPLPPRSWLMVPPPVQPPMLVHEMAPFIRWPHNIPPRPVFEHDNSQFTGFPGTSHPMPKNNYPGVPRDVPPADPLVLELIEKDTMHTINIDCIPREVRFYGEIAIIMLSWDDPREITFQPGSRRVIIDDRETLLLNFNSPYRDIILDGQRTKIRLGAPTRELFIDGKFYEAKFGGPPIKVMVGGRMHTVKLEGPLPQVRIGNMKRTDLVAGKINLIVDAKHMFPLFLDAKPQRFEIDGIPYILRFVEALQTVVINGRPFKIEFGGLPVPIYFHGVKHFLRLSVLPHGIKPGYISIINMEGGRLSSPPPIAQLPVITPNVSLPIDEVVPGARDISNEVPPKAAVTDGLHSQQNQAPSGNEQPLELLTSLMPTALAPSSGQSYTVEQASDDHTSTSNFDINVGELFQKLVAIGIVPPVKEKEQPVEDINTVRPVDFSQPDTLKIRQPSLIKRLYSGIQCSSCGVRFSPEQTVKYSQHLDWHFRQNRRDRDSARIAQSRKWYYDISDWIQYQEIEDLEERAQSWFEMQEGKMPIESEDITEEDPSVVAGANNENVSCVICQDKFEQFYNEEKEEWHLRRAIRIDDKVYHPLCYQDFKESQVRRVTEPLKCETTKVINDKQKEELETIELVDEETITILKYPSLDDLLCSVDGGTNENANEVEVISDIGEDLKLDDNLPSSESCITIVSESLSEGLGTGTSNFNASEEDNNDDDDDEGEYNGYDDDDDILQVLVLEQKIESYEIPDDDDDDDDDDDNSNDDIEAESSNIGNIKEQDDLDYPDISKVKIKQEKPDIDLPEPVVDTTHTSLTTSIDGNVELEEAPQIVIPGKIKINISKALLNKANKEVSSSSPPKESFKEPTPPPTDQASVLALVEQMQPPPPGEELCPAHIKPRIVGTKMSEYSAVMKGSELSGLCSIM